MKKLHLVFALAFSILVVCAIGASAQTKPAVAKTEKITINKKGEIHDHRWNRIGYISKDNIVKNNQGKTIYFIDKNGNVIDAAGRNLGRAQKNGNYYNVNGESVITVKDAEAEKCEILDPKGHSLGNVHQNYKLHACAAHCLAMKQKKEKAKN